MKDNRPDLLENAKRDERLWEPILSDLGFKDFDTEPLESKSDLKECTDIFAFRDVNGKRRKFGFSSRIRNVDRYSESQLKNYQSEFTFRSKRPKTGAITEENKLFTVGNPPHFFLYGWYSHKISRWFSWVMLSVFRLKERYVYRDFEKYHTREIGKDFANNQVRFKPIPLFHFRECILVYSYNHPAIPDRWGIPLWEDYNFEDELRPLRGGHVICRYCGNTNTDDISQEWGFWQCENDVECARRIQKRRGGKGGR